MTSLATHLVTAGTALMIATTTASAVELSGEENDAYRRTYDDCMAGRYR